MSKYILFTADYWKDTAERVLSTAAQSVVAVIGVDQVLPNAFTLDYKVLAGVAAGGALAALLKSWAKLGATAQVPAPVEPLRRSGGDVELRPAEIGTADPAGLFPGVNVTATAPVDENTRESTGYPVDENTPVTDETMGLAD